MSAYREDRLSDHEDALRSGAEVIGRLGEILHRLADEDGGPRGDRLGWLASGAYAFASELAATLEHLDRLGAPDELELLLSRRSLEADEAETAEIRRYRGGRS